MSAAVAGTFSRFRPTPTYTTLRDVTPKGIADRLGEPLGSTAHHVRRLAKDGLIELVRTRPVRGATEHFYVLSAELLDLLDKLELFDTGERER